METPQSVVSTPATLQRCRIVLPDQVPVYEGATLDGVAGFESPQAALRPDNSTMHQRARSPENRRDEAGIKREGREENTLQLSDGPDTGRRLSGTCQCC